VRFFEYLTLRQKDSVAGVLIQQKYSPGERIVMQGDPASSFYIIKSGLVRVLVNAQEVNRLGVGASFGEAALVSSSQPRNATVKVVEECVVLALGR
jgi:cGMP-dependent protein kinase